MEIVKEDSKKLKKQTESGEPKKRGRPKKIIEPKVSEKVDGEKKKKVRKSKKKAVSDDVDEESDDEEIGKSLDEGFYEMSESLTEEELDEKIKETDEKHSKSKHKARNFCWTLHNVDETESDKFIELYEVQGTVYQLFFTHEMGKDNKSPHIQGFMSCENGNRWSTIRNKINKLFGHLEKAKVHLEIARGSAWSNYRYITKELKKYPERKHVRLGPIPVIPGRHRALNKYDGYTKALEDGKITIQQIKEEDLGHYALHRQHYEYVNAEIKKKNQEFEMPKMIVYISGTTATGKSECVKYLGKKLKWRIYNMNCVNSFYNIYREEEIAVWNDYRSGPIPFNDLLNLTEETGMALNMKGGEFYFQPKILIFTSPEGVESAKTNEMKLNPNKLDIRFIQFERRIAFTGKLTFQPDNPEKPSIPEKVLMRKCADLLSEKILSRYKHFLEDHGLFDFIKTIPYFDKVESKFGGKIVDPDKGKVLMETSIDEEAILIE